MALGYIQIVEFFNDVGNSGGATRNEVARHGQKAARDGTFVRSWTVLQNLTPTVLFCNFYNAAASKDLFEQELQKSWVTRRIDLAKVPGVQIGYRVQAMEAVCYIERFNSSLHFLELTQRENSGQCRIEIPHSGAEHGISAHISESTRRW